MAVGQNLQLHVGGKYLRKWLRIMQQALHCLSIAGAGRIMCALVVLIQNCWLLSQPQSRIAKTTLLEPLDEGPLLGGHGVEGAAAAEREGTLCGR